VTFLHIPPDYDFDAEEDEEDGWPAGADPRGTRRSVEVDDYRALIKKYDTLRMFVQDLYFGLDGCRDTAWRIRCTEDIENLHEALDEDL
jgi:hypothetical protein